MEVVIKQIQEDEQLVYGEVYAPDVADSHGDFMRATEIKKMAHNFIKNARVDQIDFNHNHELTGSYIVESFIARKGDDTFIEGSWVVAVHIPDENVWKDVKNKEINGFSLEAAVRKVETVVEVDIPEFVTGGTSEEGEEPHSHTFKVYFDDEGNFTGGETDEVNGHSHLISKGTLTDETAGHAHTFSFVEGFPLIVNEDA